MGEKKNVRSMWAGKKVRERKNVLIGVSHLFIFCVVVRDDTDGRKLLVGVVWQ